jgi:hypothetical protein
VRHIRVGHDGGRVAVDQHHLISFFHQGLAGLGSGIVEFARLADHDGTRSDDEDFMDVFAFRHE